jgi:ABC-type proline/glycine betaine transport system permease subunit
MNRPSLFRDSRSIINPFRYIAGEQALVWGLLFMIISALIGWVNQYWQDGLIDLHFRDPGSVWQHLAMVLINWLCALIILYPLGIMLTHSKIRFIDMAGTLALARFPMVLAVLTGFSGSMTRTAEYVMYEYLKAGQPVELKSYDLILTIFQGLFILLMMVWMIALHYQAFKISANIKGNRAGVSFAAGILVAYALSKVVTNYI